MITEALSAPYLKRETGRDADMGVGVVETPEELGSIARPGCAAVIWQRRPLSSFQSWVNGLAVERLPSARLILWPDCARAAIDEVCAVSGTPDGPERCRLVDDIAALVDIFAGVMRTPFVRLRLDRISDNACCKFHIDAVTARLICTYRGEGTQYGLSRNGIGPIRVLTVPTCAPILLRGSLWSDPPHPGLLHRSPPIDGLAQTRLVLVLDPIVDRDDTT